MRSVRAGLAISTVALLCGSAQAQVSLRDALGAAIRTNPDLLQAGATLEERRGLALQAAGIDDFVLDASARFRADEVSLVAGSPLQQPSHRELGFGLGLRKPLPTGGSVGLRLTTDYTRNEFASVSDTGTVFTTSSSYSPAALLVVDQPLLRGIGAASRGDVRRTRVELDAARLARENAAAVALREVARAYWELRFAAEVLEVRRQLARSARDQLAIVAANIDAGKMPPSASAEVEVAAGLRDEEVLLAGRSVLERSLELRELVGLPIGADATVVAASDPLAPDGAAGTLAEALALAERRNPALASARAGGRAAAVDVDVTENGLLPQLDLSLVAGPIGNSDDAAEAFRQLGRFDAYTVQANLVFQHPLGNRDARGRALSARARWRRASLDADQIATQTAAAVVRAHALTEEARRRLEVIAPTSEAAALDLSAERARFEVGRASNFDVLRRQEEVAQTQLRSARARADLLIARAALWAATGEIFDRYGVKVQ
jgi:outer membrane protein TolC